MSQFKGLDRSQGAEVPGDLIKKWASATDEAMKKLRRDMTCPNCGGLMVYGEPCLPQATPEEGK